MEVAKNLHGVLDAQQGVGEVAPGLATQAPQGLKSGLSAFEITSWSLA